MHTDRHCARVSRAAVGHRTEGHQEQEQLSRFKRMGSAERASVEGSKSGVDARQQKDYQKAQSKGRFLLTGKRPSSAGSSAASPRG